MRHADLDDDRLLAIEVETALKSLRIATSRQDDDSLRMAVDDLRRTFRQLSEPTIASEDFATRASIRHASAGREAR